MKDEEETAVEREIRFDTSLDTLSKNLTTN